MPALHPPLAPTSPTEMPMPRPALPSPGAALRWLLKETATILAIALAISAALLLVFRQDPLTTFIYCTAITLCCSISIQALHRGLSWLVQRRLSPEQRAAHGSWPGWPLMGLSLLLGTVLGYSAGTELGNWITGHNSPGILNASLRRALSTLFIALIPGVLITLYFVNRGRLDAAEARAQAAQREAAENQLRLLESQLEPHMLFNTLANLRVLIGLDPARAQAMLDQLIAFLRATLNASRSGSHALSEEFARLQDYLALMQVRMGTRLRPRLLLPPELAELPVPPLLLQPLVENAIKHGLEPHMEGGELIVSAALEQGQVLLQVRDTGAGLGQAPASEGTRFGLDQVRSRLATQFGGAASFELRAATDGRGGTLASIRLPLPDPRTLSKEQP